MTNPNVIARQARKRFVNRGAVVLALVFMIAFAAVQVEANGLRGLTDGKFVGVTLLVGFFAYRMGRWLSLGLDALLRAGRAARSGRNRE
jgi:hypothetical protein